ncbi:MAG: hypothetical protein HC800_01715 [Phormidesmis sp. RL_2_1]|nr:hypothetical protein [Phormidesmis sp. RL_2_1]
MKGKTKGKLSKAAVKVSQGLLAAAILVGVAGIAHRAAWAQALVQQQGVLAPMEDTYDFEGEMGQSMTIELQSDEFDTVLVLKGPNGEVLASNDDYGGSLNSTVVIELPESGTYSAIATSFSSQGGSYQIEIRPSSEYEQVFSRAYNLAISEDYDDSIEAYTAAISLDDTDPSAYLGRAESIINRAYLNATVDFSSPSDWPQDVIDAVVADYTKAADLLQQQGDPDSAAALREQLLYFTGTPTPPPPEPGIQPDMPDEPIPVEPDGGIGDGATPLP